MNVTGRPVSAPSGVSNDNQRRVREREDAETTPELPSPRVREGLTEHDGSMYSYDVTRAGQKYIKPILTAPRKIIVTYLMCFGWCSWFMLIIVALNLSLYRSSFTQNVTLGNKIEGYYI